MDAEGNTYIGVPFERIALTVSERTTCEMVAEEVRRALEQDQDLRILIRESVREAIAKINFVEVVAAAAKKLIDKEIHST